MINDTWKDTSRRIMWRSEVVLPYPGVASRGMNLEPVLQVLEACSCPMSRNTIIFLKVISELCIA